jgi:hypothetical protein
MNMKKYIAPRAEIVCFAAVEGLTAWSWTDNVSVGAAATGSEINFTITNNPEGEA